MASSPEYPRTAVNKLGRLANRGKYIQPPPPSLKPFSKGNHTNKTTLFFPLGTYDYTTIHTLINACPILHVSFNDPQHPFPVVLPMLGCTGSFSPTATSSSAAPDPSSPQDLYIHGYISGRIFKTSSSSSDSAGLPITVAASFLDGLVLSLAPFHNSCNYRSAVVYGYASLVQDEAEALYAMKLITDNMLPERWAKSRSPPTKAELASTAILRVRIESVSFLPFPFLHLQYIHVYIQHL